MPRERAGIRLAELIKTKADLIAQCENLNPILARRAAVWNSCEAFLRENRIALD